MSMQMNSTVDSKSLLQSTIWLDALYSHEHKTADPQSMPWLSTLHMVFESSFVFDEDAFHTMLTDIDVSSVPFKELMLPFLRYIWSSFSSVLSDTDIQVQSQQVIVKTAALQFTKSAIQIAGKTLIFELHKSRLSGNLQGETSEARYQDFIAQHFRSPEQILRWLSEYPVLTRLLCEKIPYIHNALIPPVQRLIQDSCALSLFGINDVRQIVHIDLLGDLHNGGQCVLLFHFENDKKIVYKPHSLAVDQTFQYLLQWFNEKQIAYPFRTISVIDCTHYGWVEYVHHAPCVSSSEINEFYIRQGQYLALLYMLNATDMHYENIIACSKDPILIDLEALFHNNTLYAQTDTATNRALKILNDSVMRTSLLPISVRNTNDIRLDISGLGSQQSQHMYAYQFADAFTDQMRIEKSLIPVQAQHNHPVHNQECFDDAGQFVNEIKMGFSEIYQVALSNKQTFMDTDGPLQAFRNTPIRNIIRETQVYSTMLDASKHPKYLKTGLAREQVFGIMHKAAEKFPILSHVVHSEIADMLQDDVPYFWSIPNSSIVYDQRGKRIANFYYQDSYTRVAQTVQQLTLQDCKQQLQHIEYALSTVRIIHQMTDDNHQQLPYRPLDWNQQHLYSTDMYLQEAILIGEQLLSEAIWGENEQDITWISLGINQFEQVEYKAMELGIYDGLMGIGIFYAHLAKESKNERFEKVARACFQGVWNEYTDTSYAKAGASAFTGYASILYAIHHYYHIWPELDFVKKGKYIVDQIAKQATQDNMYDFLGGAAGIIPVLLDFYQISGYEACMEIAEVYGQRLLQQAIPVNEGVAWLQSNRPHGKPLAGLAHGTSGIAFALFRLYEATSRTQYLQTARKAIQYDNSLFNPEQQNWTDLRNVEVTNEPLFPVYWCNGAVGVGLSRLFAMDYYPDVQLKQDFEIALHKTLQAGFDKTSHSLCHGNIGNLDFLLSASLKCADTQLLNVVYTRMNMMLQELDSSSESWRCGIPGSSQPTPNLFTGLAGIGYVLLRLYNTTIPSVLILESPAVHE